MVIVNNGCDSPDSFKGMVPKERGLVADEAPLFWWYLNQPEG